MSYQNMPLKNVHIKNSKDIEFYKECLNNTYENSSALVISLSSVEILSYCIENSTI